MFNLTPKKLMKNYPQRPPRISLFQGVKPFYFITFNTFKRRKLLATIELHEALICFCQCARLEYDIEVGRYVIMPDHIHLFVRFSEQGGRLSSWVQSLRSILGKILLLQGINKPHWQEGFFDHVMRNSESYAEKWQYVKNNPIRKGLCEQAEEWPYQGEINRISY